MADITSGVLYAPMPPMTDDMDEHASIFCVDKQKWNMLWLAEPRTDSTAIDILAKENIAVSINEYMDKTTREHLRKPPLAFIKYWNGLIKQGVLAMARDASPGVMECRAQDAHERVYGLEVVDNVVYAKFGRT